MIEIYGKPVCPFCDKAKALCQQNNYEYVYKQLDVDFTREELFEQFPGARTFPQIKIDGESIGGYQQLEEWHNTDWNER
jgi:glutaredoxin 3